MATMFEVTGQYVFKDIYCNGYIITLCPWCRPDSQPWKNGRGI